MSLPKSKLVKSQTKKFEKNIMVDGKKGLIEVIARYDDNCGNGHNSFGITGTVYSSRTSKSDRNTDICGCIHEEIEKHFPELRHLIKWHLVSSDGPMHYIANTMYHASDRDHNGLLKGEVQHIKNGRSGLSTWELQHPNGDKVSKISWLDSETKPVSKDKNQEWKPVTRIGEGKVSNINAARNSAVWSDATLAQLQDKKALEKRLPVLMKAFKADMVKLGFVY